MKVAENVVDFDEHRSAEQAAKDLIPVLSEDHGPGIRRPQSRSCSLRFDK
jgi:hypothetical protein